MDVDGIVFMVVLWMIVAKRRQKNVGTLTILPMNAFVVPEPEFRRRFFTRQLQTGVVVGSGDSAVSVSPAENDERGGIICTVRPLRSRQDFARKPIVDGNSLGSYRSRFSSRSPAPVPPVPACRDSTDAPPTDAQTHCPPTCRVLDPRTAKRKNVRRPGSLYSRFRVQAYLDPHIPPSCR